MIAVTAISLLNAVCLIPALLLLVTAGAQLFHDNDQPLIAIFVTILAGAVAALGLITFCIGSVKHHRISPAIGILAFTMVFNVASLPVARWMTRLEQERRYQPPATELGAAGQPATRSKSK